MEIFMHLIIRKHFESCKAWVWKIFLVYQTKPKRYSINLEVYLRGSVWYASRECPKSVGVWSKCQHVGNRDEIVVEVPKLHKLYTLHHGWSAGIYMWVCIYNMNEAPTMWAGNFFSIYIYIYIYICMCSCEENESVKTPPHPLITRESNWYYCLTKNPLGGAKIDSTHHLNDRHLLYWS